MNFYKLDLNKIKVYPYIQRLAKDLSHEEIDMNFGAFVGCLKEPQLSLEIKNELN